MMDETFANRSGHDNDHDMNDIKERLLNMEKYIYDIKAIQTIMPQVKYEIQCNKDDIGQMKINIKQINFMLGKKNE